MYVPELYLNVNTIQRTPNLLALELAQGSFRKSPTPDQQFVDLGCGTGDFTRQELLPRCQPCRRIVATDVSQEMVRFAERSFSHPQIEYDVYDFRDDASKIVGKYGRFDRAYSFFALHYAEDLVSALRNVADLMTDDGECLLVFAARIPGYAVWRKVVQMDRWKSYAEPAPRCASHPQQQTNHQPMAPSPSPSPDDVISDVTDDVTDIRIVIVIIAGDVIGVRIVIVTDDIIGIVT
ncbi:putative acid methyltransferase [Ixodes scapularis]